MENIVQKLAVAATAGAVLSFTVIDANPAQASLIQYDFTVDVTTGDLAGSQYDGYFRFDDEDLTSAGSETLDVSKVSFDFNGTTYTEETALFPPLVSFEDGKLLGLNFFDIDFLGVGIFQISDADDEFQGGDSFIYGNEGVGTVAYSEPKTVPEPTTVLGLSLLGFGWLLQKKKSQNV